MVAQCTSCGAEGVTDRLHGLCPRCLFKESSPGPWDPLEPGPFGPLEIVEKLGQGGMGTVYKARQPALDRFVAVKVLAPALAADPEFRERFVREAQVLAKLTHPNIVSVHDFGEREGLYYLVMEFVEGVTLRELLHERESLLKIVPSICDALEYAHARGVVHRDIKPENILVDAQGRVKIADFGIAKIAEPARTITRAGTVIGTPAYMAPEQSDRPGSVDHRADLYSLGAVLYEVLTGKAPPPEAERPSRISKADPRLDEIVRRALSSKPEARHGTAAELRNEITIVITTAPAPPRRTPWAIVAAALLVLAGAVGYLAFRPATGPAPAAPASQEIVLTEKGPFRPGGGGMPQAVALSPDGKRIATWGPDWRIVLMDAIDLRVLAEVGRTQQGINDLCFSSDGTKLAAGEGPRPAVWDVATGRKISAPKVSDPSWVQRIAFSPDGREILTASSDLFGWDAATGDLKRTIARGNVRAFAFSPDGTSLVVQRRDFGLAEIGLATGEEKPLVPGTTGDLVHAGSLAWAMDSKRLALLRPSGKDASELMVWSREQGKVLHRATLPGRPVGALGFGPRFFAAQTTSELALFRESDYSRVRSIEEGAAAEHGGRPFAVSDDHLFLSAPGELRRIEIETGRVTAVAVPHGGTIEDHAFLPDGKGFVSVGSDGKVRTWDIDSGRETSATETGESHLNRVAVSPDGELAVLVAKGRPMVVFDLKTRKPIRRIPQETDDVHAIAITPQGKLLVGHAYGNTRVYDVSSGRLEREFGARGTETLWVEFSADGRRAVRYLMDRPAVPWDAEKGAALPAVPDLKADHVRLSTEGSRLYFVRRAGREMHEVGVAETETGKILKMETFPDRYGPSIDIDPLGRRLAVLFHDRLVLIDAATFKTVHVRRQDYFTRVRFSPDGRALSMRGAGSVKVLRIEEPR